MRGNHFERILPEGEADDRMINSESKHFLIEVVESYTPLKRCGREFLGHCPLHDDVHESMRVNEEKKLWYCPVCNIGGDVIRFIEKVEGLTFQQAVAHLGINDNPSTRANISIKQKARLEKAIRVEWARTLSIMIGARLRDISEQELMAQKVLDELDVADVDLLRGEIERAARAWTILAALDDDLAEPDRLSEMWREKESIEGFVGGLE